MLLIPKSLGRPLLTVLPRKGLGKCPGKYLGKGTYLFILYTNVENMKTKGNNV